jgi:hypothetical protein
MSRSITALVAILIISLTIGFAREVNAFGLGRLGAGFGRLGAIGKGGSVAPPPTGCASTGIFDLSNTCNDIYFIGALR